MNTIAAAMVARDRILTTLRTAAIMEYRDDHQHLKAHETIDARRPADLRVAVSSPFGVALIVTANGNRIQIFDPGNNALYFGAATASTLDRFARIPMEPGAAIGLMMGLAPDAVRLANASSTLAPDGTVVLDYQADDGGAREAGFVDGHLTMVRALGNGGVIEYEVRYSDYRDIGGVQFPYVVEASFPAAGSSLKFVYQRPIVNDPIDDSVFTIVPAANTREIDLDQQPVAPTAPRG